QNLRKERSPYISHGFMPPVFPDPFPYPSELERMYDKKVLSGNLHDKVSFRSHELTFGVNYEYQKNDIGGWGFLIPAFSRHQAGLFVYDQWKLNPKTILHAALRYDLGHIRIREYTDWFPSGQEGAPEHLTRAAASERSFDNLNWTVGTNYTFGKTGLKLNLGTSFRMPLAKELAANGVNYHYFRYEKGNSGLSPEKSYQLDLGIFRKTEKLELEFTPFYNYFPNYIYLNPTAGHDYLYGAGNQVFEYQQSRVMRYGAEARAFCHITKRWTAELSADYLYNRQLSGSKTGLNLPFSPPPSWSGTLSWHPPILQESYISLDIKHALKQDRIVPPEKVTPAYTVFGISAGTEFILAKQKWSLNLQVNNLLNARYLNHTSFYRLIDLPETGRNMTVNLKIPLSFAI
ncbi:MAG: TonB-dependent receptor, partial [Leadbetterella sp.]|nr:TonB-dependent receptor [Leadbetterella sp.]